MAQSSNGMLPDNVYMVTVVTAVILDGSERDERL